ncbi:MAG: hypothetical protein RG741_01660 [Bacteroidales bacterium]|nr:hypothetical protein [Bacteroidales bacterium]
MIDFLHLAGDFCAFIIKMILTAYGFSVLSDFLPACPSHPTEVEP